MKRQYNPTTYYHTGFEALMDRRINKGLSVEEMAQLIAEMSEVDRNFTPITPEAIKAVEEDPLHGLSTEALMYIRFMGAEIRIKGHSKCAATVENKKRFMATKANNKKAGIKARIDRLLEIDSTTCVLTHINVCYQDEQGAKRQVYVEVKFDNPVWEPVKKLLHEALVNRLADEERAIQGYAKREDMLG